MLIQGQSRIKLTPRHHCSSASCSGLCVPSHSRPSGQNFQTLLSLCYPPHFKSPPLNVAITWLHDTWPKSSAPRTSQSDVSLFPHRETFSVLNHKIHVCSRLEPRFLQRATQRNTRWQGEGKTTIIPFLNVAWSSILPGRHQAAISRPSSPSRCCCGDLVPNVCKSKNICFAL